MISHSAHIPGRHRSHNRRTALGVFACVVLLISISITGAEVIRSRGNGKKAAPRPTRVSPAANISTASSWVAANLDHSSRVLADAAAVAALVSAGVSPDAVRPVSALRDAEPPASGCNGFAFVLDTPALAATAADNARIGVCRSTSLPVAIFGTGAEAVAVREVFPDGQAILQQRLATDAVARRLAGESLLVNPGLFFEAQPRAVIARGALDLRTATVLAVLAEHTTAHVSRIPQDACEAAAGLPARTVQLTVRDAAALTTTLVGLAAPYQPRSITRPASGGVQLVWRVGLTSVTPIQ